MLPDILYLLSLQTGNAVVEKIETGQGVATLLGVDIGGTKTAFVAGTAAGDILERVEIPSDVQRGPEAMITAFAETARDLVARHSSIESVGVSIGGPVDPAAGLVLGPPNLPGWEHVELRDDLARRLGLPVAIEHDAKAGALAEWKFGAGRGVANLVFLTLGTGLGAGIIVDNQLLRGSRHAAGEIGHWRVKADGPDVYGKRGSLEGWASGAGLSLLAPHLDPETFPDVISAQRLFERAQDGDAAARSVIDQSAEALGSALALVADFIAPERIILGSLARRLGPDYLGKIIASFEAEALNTHTQIVLSELGDRIGDMAALTVAMGAAPSDGGALSDALRVFADLGGIRSQIEAASALIESTMREGGRVFACGNGGSAAEAQHFVTELVGRYKTNRVPLPAIWLGGDTGQMSCIANDFSWDDVFSRPLRALAQPGDIVLALSTSGRSPNVVRCLEVAGELGLKSVALLGNGGGAAAHHATHPVIVPATGTARVQEAHLFLIHTFCDAIERHYASQ